jgi:hypothetical protein
VSSSICRKPEIADAKIQPSTSPSVDIAIVNQNEVRRTFRRSAGSGESK